MPRRAVRIRTVTSQGRLLCFIFILLSWGSSTLVGAAPRRFRVVLDPGHGGSDHGAVYRQGKNELAEKEITLRLAQEAAIHLRLRGIEAVLTRQNDHEVSLGARTALANKLKADLFISIHMNATESALTQNNHHPQPEGVETYFLNTTSDASSKRLARLENSVLGDTSFDTPQDLDVALILKDLRLDANLTESKRLACVIQGALATSTARYSRSPAQTRNRGVKQALFHVLLGADMPSVLVEAGFMTNATDRSIVTSPVGIAQMGNSIARAVEYYRRTRGTPSALVSLNTCQVH